LATSELPASVRAPRAGELTVVPPAGLARELAGEGRMVGNKPVTFAALTRKPVC
jgi:hypothetical protein